MIITNFKKILYKIKIKKSNNNKTILLKKMSKKIHK